MRRPREWGRAGSRSTNSTEKVRDPRMRCQNGQIGHIVGDQEALLTAFGAEKPPHSQERDEGSGCGLANQ